MGSKIYVMESSKHDDTSEIYTRNQYIELLKQNELLKQHNNLLKEENKIIKLNNFTTFIGKYKGTDIQYKDTNVRYGAVKIEMKVYKKNPSICINIYEVIDYVSDDDFKIGKIVGTLCNGSVTMIQ